MESRTRRRNEAETLAVAAHSKEGARPNSTRALFQMRGCSTWCAARRANELSDRRDSGGGASRSAGSALTTIREANISDLGKSYRGGFGKLKPERSNGLHPRRFAGAFCVRRHLQTSVFGRRAKM